MSVEKLVNTSTVDLEEHNIILAVPIDAIALDIVVKILDDNGIVRRFQKTLKISDIMNARSDFVENVEFSDNYDSEYRETADCEYYKMG